MVLDLIEGLAADAGIKGRRRKESVFDKEDAADEGLLILIENFDFVFFWIIAVD